MTGPKRNLNDQDVISLLSRLKASDAKYPPDLLSKRRAGFMAGIVTLLGGTAASGHGGGAGGAASAGGSSSHAGAAIVGVSQIDKLVIALEVIVLTGMTAYLGVTAYDNRDYLKNLLFPGTPTAVQVAPSIEPTASLISAITGTPTPTETLELTITSTGTGESISQPEETPQPGDTGSGLHLGQTKNPPTKSPPQKP